MNLFRYHKKTLFFIYYFLKFKSIKLAYLFAHYNVSEKDANGLQLTQRNLMVTNNGNKISLKQLSKFGFSTAMLIRLLKCNHIKVQHFNEEFFMVQVYEMTFKISTLSNMAVLYEIFVEDIYSFETIIDNLVVVDIGMNVGVAAINFANKPNVKKVYGYEPFKNTFNEANENIALNQKIATKLVLENIGVSNVNEQRNIPLFESGILSASTIHSNNSFGLIKDNFISVQMQSIHQIMNKVILENPNSPILLKIDCEGEEYAIMDMLNSSSHFEKVICIMLEWHEKGFDNLVEILKHHKFQIFHKRHESEYSGMIYAYKIN